MSKAQVYIAVYHLDVFAQAKVGEFEVRSGTAREMHQQHAIDTFPILIEHNDVCEVSVGSILTNFLQRIALCCVRPILTRQ